MCQACRTIYTPPDIRTPGKCPECDSPKYVRQRCDDCPTLRLDEAMGTNAGRFLGSCQMKRMALKLGFSISLDEVTAEEFNVMTMIESEDNRYQSQQIKNRSKS